MMSEETRALVERTRETLKRRAAGAAIGGHDARDRSSKGPDHPAVTITGCRRGRELWPRLTRAQKDMILGRMKEYPHLWPCARRGWNWINRLDCASCPDAVLETQQ